MKAFSTLKALPGLALLPKLNARAVPSPGCGLLSPPHRSEYFFTRVGAGGATVAWRIGRLGGGANRRKNEYLRRRESVAVL